MGYDVKKRDLFLTAIYPKSVFPLASSFHSEKRLNFTIMKYLP